MPAEVKQHSASTRNFQLKGTSVTMTVLEVYTSDLSNFESFLKQKILQAPLFFRSTPIVIDLNKFEASDPLDLIELVNILKNNSLVPIALRGGDGSYQTVALEIGLGVLSLGRTDEVDVKESSVKPSRKEAAVVQEPVTLKVGQITKVITKPVRSGQQIYAQKGDLLILSSVSVGAEIIADGHIHVYGPLRGRALAGVSGDVEARIFCSQLEAELVSIAGCYKLSDQLKSSPCWKDRAHLFLEGKNLHVESI